MNLEIPYKYTEVIDLALDTIEKDKQALIFVNTKSSSEAQAERISKKNKKTNQALDILADEILNILSSPTKQCKRLSECVRKGIAFHHSGLNSKQRELIEDNFRNGLIKIICCTPTLAAGLDLPAYRTIIKDLKRFTRRGMQFIPVLEYLQMAGRAGRPKYDKIGEAICIATSEKQKEEILEMYIKGKPEKIFSKLSAEPVLRTYVLSLISTGLVNSKKQLFEFFSKTFFAHQYGDIQKMESLLLKVVDLLKNWNFINVEENSNSMFQSADSLNEENKYVATLLGKRISELYLDPYTANKLIEGLQKEQEKNDFSYLHLISNTLEMMPLLSIRKSDYEKLEEKLSLNEDYILDTDLFFDDHYYLLSTIKTAFFFEQWINEMTEDRIFEKFNVRPGEIKFKIDVADWLLFSCYELSKVLMLKSNLNVLTKLRLRLKYGVKEELMSLVKIELIGKVRARKLFDSGIKNIKDLKNIGLETLKSIVGEKTAINIKKKIQMG